MKLTSGSTQKDVDDDGVDDDDVDFELSVVTLLFVPSATPLPPSNCTWSNPTAACPPPPQPPARHNHGRTPQGA